MHQVNIEEIVIKIKLNNSKDLYIYPMLRDESRMMDLLEIFEQNQDCIKYIQCSDLLDIREIKPSYITMDLKHNYWLINDLIIIYINCFSLRDFIDIHFMYDCDLEKAIDMIEIQLNKSEKFIKLNDMLKLIKLSYEKDSIWESGSEELGTKCYYTQYIAFNDKVVVNFEKLNNTDNVRIEI